MTRISVLLSGAILLLSTVAWAQQPKEQPHIYSDKDPRTGQSLGYIYVVVRVEPPPKPPSPELLAGLKAREFHEIPIPPEWLLGPDWVSTNADPADGPKISQ